MIGPVIVIDGDTLPDILSNVLPALIIGLALMTALAWGLARLLAGSLDQVEDHPHSLLRYLPITPLLLLGIFIVPYLDLNLIFSGILLGVLGAPPLLMRLNQYNRVRTDDTVQAQLTQQAILRSGVGGMVMLGLVFLLSGIAYYAITPAMRARVNSLLDEMILPIVAALIVGLMIGVLLGLLRYNLAVLLENRHRAGEYSFAVEGLLGTLRSFIEAMLTQFHGTPLVIVLAIAAALLPFTTASQQLILTLLLIPPAVSAALAASMVDNPPPDKPGVYQHIRTGLVGIAQICVGYLIGVAMLAPLDAMREWMVTESDQTMDALWRHLELTFVALGLSTLIGVGAGILSSRVEILRLIFTFLGNIGRTIPSLAVLALALPLFGVGFTPSLVALIFIGTLPILVNTTVGIVEVSRDIKEAARGMGMNGLQVLVRVEIPIAVPVIMAGIRTSAVLVVASAVLAGFIGGGGLGALIIRGDSSGNDQILFTGAILSTMLAVFLEYLFGWLETVITPRGLRES